MTIELTEEQQACMSALDGTLARIRNPKTCMEYVLIPIQEYEALASDLDDRREQEAVHRMSWKNAVARMREES